jgi:class 3 adenylate cyclase
VSAESRSSSHGLFAGRYRLQRQLGEGAKKRVHLARDTRLERDVALALIKGEGLDEAGRVRVRREAQAMASLGDHPHIVDVYDVGEERGQLYMVSEYMSGGDLEARLAAAPERRLPIDEVQRIALQVCSALGHAHARDVIHRDLKPGNVWLGSDGSARLGDFGLALSLDRSRLTTEGSIVGTATYMPPEQAMSGEIGAHSDLYALGVMLYEMVTGRPPFVGNDSVAVISQHLNSPPVAPSWHNEAVQPALEALILRLLEKDPAKRHESAAAVTEDLASVAAAPAAGVALAESPAKPLERLARGVFVGRDGELGQLRSAVDGTFSGRGRVLLVVGEPGIGKTRTVEEFGTYARMRGAQVLWGRCHEGEGAPPYWPWVQIVRAYVHDREPQDLMSEMGPGAADIADVVSAVRERLPGLPTPPSLEPEQARFRLFDSVATFLRNASRRAPLVLVLDDLHWADKPTLLLLQLLAQELAGARVLLVGTYRDVELGRQHPLADALASLARTEGSQRVLLRGLQEEDVGRFIAQTAHVEPPPGLVGAVFRETEGNPFFVNEVVRLLEADGRLKEPGESGAWSVSIPQGVREVIGRRLNRLSEACNQLLTLASVVGRQFELRLLERFADLAPEAVLAAVDEAVVARVVDEVEGSPGRYSFSHALIRETLYEELSTGRRLQLHRRVGSILEELYAADPEPHLAELARHFGEAAPGGDVEKAIDYARRAAERAFGQLAFEESVEHNRRALLALEHDDLPREETRCRLLTGLAQAHHRSGDTTPAREAAEQAVALGCQLGSRDLAFAAFQALPSTFLPGSPDQLVRDCASKLLDLLGDERCAERAIVLATLAQTYMITPEVSKGLALANEAADLADELGDPAARVVAFSARFGLALNPDATHELLEQMQEVARIEEEAQVPPNAFGAPTRTGIAMIAIELGDMEEFDRQMDAARATAAAQRSSLAQYWLLLFTGIKLGLEGRFDEGERLADEALAIGQRANPAMAGYWYPLQLLPIRREQGRFGELEEQVRGIAGFLTAVPAWRCFLAWILAETSKTGEARDIVEELAGDDLAALPFDVNWFPSTMSLAEVASQLGLRPQAETLYRRMLPYGDRSPMVGAVYSPGSLERYLGMLARVLGRYDEAEAHFEAGIAHNERIGARAWTAHTRYEYARMLHERAAPGDREHASALAATALEDARALSMTVLTERILTLRMAQQGADPSDVKGSILRVTSTVQDRQIDLGTQAAPDGTVTLMFSDMEGFTEMTERLGDLEAREVIRRHNRIVRERLAAHGGYEVELQGDGFLLAFGSARRALLCAIAIQREFDTHNRSHPEQPIRVRIGLHTGEALRDAEKFFGRTVILASRIAAQAQGGQILVSSLLKELTRSVGDLRFGEVRTVALKGIAQPQELSLVDWRGADAEG